MSTTKTVKTASAANTVNEPRFSIGIDLGTTHCALAYVDIAASDGEKTSYGVLDIPQLTAPGSVESLPLLPSFLYLPHPSELVTLVIRHRVLPGEIDEYEAWLKRADKEVAQWSFPREGKRVGIFSETVEETLDGVTREFRRVISVTERTIDRHGVRLLVPQITVEGWWTSLGECECSNEKIIDLYCDHATSEQFHSEFKTDLDIERLPSGKFATNDLVLACAVLTYNILRWIGIVGLTGPSAPIRHAAKRRRLRTVMQELMYLAARVVESGRRLGLRFSAHCPALPSFEALYGRLCPP